MPDSGINHLFQPEPEFLRERLDEYYVGKVKNLWGNQHPLKGRFPGEDSVQLRTNDYLCLSDDRRIVDAEVDALRKGGHGDAASRVWAHHGYDLISEVEKDLADLMEAQDAILTTSGYTANLGLIQVIGSPTIPLYLDMKAHMSLWEGAVSARSNTIAFAHNDPESLERKVRLNGPGIVAVDALYSTDGAIAPLAEFVEVCEKYGCAIVVDETHSFGTQGPEGAGLVH